MPTLTLSTFVAGALNLDDHVMRHELRLEVLPSPRGTLTVSASAADLAVVLDDLLSRSRSEAESGWDMTGPERRACAVAWPKAKAQMAAQSLHVVQGPFGRVTLTAA
jgi:hypothetical protein